jgi:hypothetical protein
MNVSVDKAKERKNNCIGDRDDVMQEQCWKAGIQLQLANIIGDDE